MTLVRIPGQKMWMTAFEWQISTTKFKGCLAINGNKHRDKVTQAERGDTREGPRKKAVQLLHTYTKSSSQTHKQACCQC